MRKTWVLLVVFSLAAHGALAQQATTTQLPSSAQPDSLKTDSSKLNVSPLDSLTKAEWIDLYRKQHAHKPQSMHPQEAPTETTQKKRKRKWLPWCKGKESAHQNAPNSN